ncbi:hypothetical protein BC938DRAFT_475013 [Jimgerdemannia flammicorona]|uniref:Uncharacterized protein n=1 Tax=Jimgerdemannia flammicorona TaxID=994334 RepID=A0A433Q175_9FUNG|nr:hypothetical protein BC938DRAFT_475013 [Jimgerdemannia flammicorona]
MSPPLQRPKARPTTKPSSHTSQIHTISSSQSAHPTSREAKKNFHPHHHKMTPAWVTFPPHSWFYRNQDVLTLVALTLLALLTRLHRIDSPEAFVDGELATRHFRGTFHDVRPPLARLLVALGTVGTHSSTILPIALRTLGAVFGALHSPLAHLTVRTLGYSWLAGVLAGMTVIWGERF